MSDDETMRTDAALPAVIDSARSPAPEIQDAGRTAVFSALVQNDQDVTGLVAYSIFKQNELDWYADFRKAKGREPNADEVDAYIIGESTQRRFATYRMLAESTLAGAAPDMAGKSAPHAPAMRPATSMNGGPKPLILAALALVVIVGVYLAARFGTAPH
ncbi:MAG: hypothetical protein KGL46_09245 [Hyphomicrobiales bacterium]|nr:hypothetical protein [Hyphomicrobiales bacterium]